MDPLQPRSYVKGETPKDTGNVHNTLTELRLQRDAIVGQVVSCSTSYLCLPAYHCKETCNTHIVVQVDTSRNFPIPLCKETQTGTSRYRCAHTQQNTWPATPRYCHASSQETCLRLQACVIELTAKKSHVITKLKPTPSPSCSSNIINNKARLRPHLSDRIHSIC